MATLSLNSTHGWILATTFKSQLLNIYYKFVLKIVPVYLVLERDVHIPLHLFVWTPEQFDTYKLTYGNL